MDFVSAVSHEMRTPLTSIRMYAEMLNEGWVKDDETAREYFGLIGAESERLARLVNNVLDFSRIQKGKKRFRPERGDPAETIRTLKEVGFNGFIIPDHVPHMTDDTDWCHRGRAWTVGYIQALLDAVEA